MSVHESYLGLAQLLCYPEDKTALLESCDRISHHFRESGLESPAATFGAFLKDSTLSEMQEDYVVSIDFNPKGSLYLGHHLHGDDQKKGAFMIDIRQEFGRHEFNPEGNELPDHLAVLLGFLAHLVRRGEDDYRRQFIAEKVLPGLDRMMASNPEPRQSAWRFVVESAQQLCRADCQEV